MKIKKRLDWFFQPVDASSIAAFRILFGLVMFYECFRYFYNGRIESYFIKPEFLFAHLPFIKALPGDLMYIPFVIFGISALFVALGLFYRLSAVLFFSSYTYIFLLDKARYNNHYYFISLLGFLLIFVSAHNWLSLDSKRNPRSGTVPYWNVLLLQGQLFVVYFFGGIAKLNWDWLRGQPVGMWYSNRANYPVIGEYFTQDWALNLITYGGLIFDLSIGFLLIYRRTRLIGLVMLIAFHSMNNWIFSIGVFPILGIASAVIFVKPGSPRRFMNWIAKWFKYQFPKPDLSKKWNPNYIVVSFVIIFLLSQFLIPLRHLAIPGNPSWTEEGHNFAWHMKLRDKSARINMVIIESNGTIHNVDFDKYLTSKQISKMSKRPHMIIQFVDFLEKRAHELGMKNPEIKARVRVSLNGRPRRLLIDPDVNLAEVEYSIWRHNDWILHLEKGLPIGE